MTARIPGEMITRHKRVIVSAFAEKPLIARQKKYATLSLFFASSHNGLLWQTPITRKRGAVRAGTQMTGKAARPAKLSRLLPRAQPKKASRPTPAATSPMAEQGAEADACFEGETNSSEVTEPQINSLDATKARNERAMSRLRPLWWGPRIEGAYTRLLKLRPVNRLLSPSLAAGKRDHWQ